MPEFNFGKNIETDINPSEIETSNLEIKHEENNPIAEEKLTNSEDIQKDLDQARQDALQILNEEKESNESPITTEKKKPNSDWFLDIEPEKRVEVSFTLIDTKQKKLSEVVFAFLEHKDFAGLDDLGRVLSKNYDSLIDKNVLKKI